VAHRIVDVRNGEDRLDPYDLPGRPHARGARELEVKKLFGRTERLTGIVAVEYPLPRPRCGAE
jgi:hypothetical protein